MKATAPRLFWLGQSTSLNGGGGQSTAIGHVGTELPPSTISVELAVVGSHCLISTNGDPPLEPRPGTVSVQTTSPALLIWTSSASRCGATVLLLSMIAQVPSACTTKTP